MSEQLHDIDFSIACLLGVVSGSIAKPESKWGADMDPDGGIKVRARVLDMLVTDRIPLLGYSSPVAGDRTRRKAGKSASAGRLLMMAGTPARA
jgi:hypothetical protein